MTSRWRRWAWPTNRTSDGFGTDVDGAEDTGIGAEWDLGRRGNERVREWGRVKKERECCAALGGVV